MARVGDEEPIDTARDAVRVLFVPGSDRADGASGPAGARGSDGAHGPDDGDAARAMVVAIAAAGAIVNGAHRVARLDRLDATRARLLADGATHDVLLLPPAAQRHASDGVERVEVVVDGWRFEVDVEPEWRARLRERATRARGDQARGGPLELRAIIPGRVVSVDVVDGDTVERGQRVLVVEAMKMQNELRAPRAGTISRVSVGAGQTVELGDLLLVVG
jgi:biotin carboxyl carrier protein